MNFHPQGLRQTKLLFSQASLASGSSIVDLGAGSGASLAWLQEQGYVVLGIDRRVPENSGSPVAMIQADFLNLPLADKTFDAVISECSLFLSGDRKQALAEAYRILKPDGLIFYSDTFFYTEAQVTALMADCGFSVLRIRDATSQWRPYYKDMVKQGRPCVCPVPVTSAEKQDVHYYLVTAKK